MTTLTSVIEGGKKKKVAKQTSTDGAKKKVAKKKTTKKPSAWILFVKKSYNDKDIQALEPKKRFAAIAEKWKKINAK